MNGISKAVVAVCFGVSAVSAAVFAGTASPVMYGVGEATTGVTATGIISSIMALISGGGGLFALLRSPSVIDAGRSIVSNITNGDKEALVVDAAFVTIAGAILSKKGAIRPELLERLGSLRKDITEGELK